MGKTYFTYPPIADYALTAGGNAVTSATSLEGDYAHTPVTWISPGRPHFGFDVNNIDDRFTLVVGGWVGVNYASGVGLSTTDQVALAVNGRVLVQNTAGHAQPLLEVQGGVTAQGKLDVQGTVDVHGKLSAHGDLAVTKILTVGDPQTPSLTVDGSTKKATFGGEIDALSNLWVKGQVYFGDPKPSVPFDPNQKPTLNPQVLSVSDGVITIANRINETPPTRKVPVPAPAARGVLRLGQQGFETHYRDTQYRWFGLTLAWFNNGGDPAPSKDASAMLRTSLQMIDGKDVALTWGPRRTSKVRLRFIWTKLKKKSQLGLVRAVDNRGVAGKPADAHDLEAKRDTKARKGQVIHRDVVTVSPKGEVRVLGTIHSMGYSEDSDVRAKESIEPLSGALAKVLRLRGVSYRWKRKVSSDRSRHIGFVAQEVEELYPEVVSTNEDGRKAVDYTRLIPVLIEAVKEQQKLIDAQSAQIGELEALMRRLAST